MPHDILVRGRFISRAAFPADGIDAAAVKGRRSSAFDLAVLADKEMGFISRFRLNSTLRPNSEMGFVRILPWQTGERS